MNTTLTTQPQTLFMALELSNTNWRIAFSNGQKIRQINLTARQQDPLRMAIVTAKAKLGLSADAPVHCCYEAGRDGFWIHRMLLSLGVANLVVDAASIEVNRRARRAKTDRLDAEKLLRMLMRYLGGETTLWRLVHVPTLAQEDARRQHRELQRLKAERTAHRSRMLSLLVLHGVVPKWSAAKPLEIESLRTWEGQPLPATVAAELAREQARLSQVRQQIALVESQQRQQVAAPQSEAARKAAKLLRLRAVGDVSGQVLAHEFFGWRAFKNRREVGALAGLCGVPYASGRMAREQGISKAGNKRVRTLMVELAWSWLKFQSGSELSRWFWERFGRGSARQRRIGIVALARKLLVALWKYVEKDQLPAGALLKAA
jgi:transposase